TGMVEPCPLIEVSGPPRERGRQYGAAAAARIRRGLEVYGAQLDDLALNGDSIVRLVGEFLPTIAAFEASYIDEMHGIAEGAAVAFEDIVLLN
ncbi:acyl-CoA--6-aminopenicillanic acid acyltransferase, partial [Klebsiella pneumoniae]